jgi:XTP/dITP diphosphohydrolase
VTDPTPVPAGSALLRLVAVMDRLRSPGGCPWDAAQDHRSLAPYLLEETYETLDAIESGDLDHLREELGDLLLQVVFHARVAAEHPNDAFDIDDVAAGIADKLVRRHPHVFADATVSTPQDVEQRWHELKQAEQQRSTPVDGLPTAMPALALAGKTVTRLQRGGIPMAEVTPTADDAQSRVGLALLGMAAESVAAGVEPEQALRVVLRRVHETVRGAHPPQE